MSETDYNITERDYVCEVGPHFPPTIAMKPWVIYVRKEEGYPPKSAMLLSPRYDHLLFLNLSPSAKEKYGKPCWTLEIDEHMRPTIAPSINAEKEHFYIRNGEVEWCDEPV